MADVNASSFNWNGVGLDLALAIDNEIGLDTQKIKINVAGESSVFKNSLDHHLRQNLIDLDYTITQSENAYTVLLHVAPLEDSGDSKFPEFEEDGQINSQSNAEKLQHSDIMTSKSSQDIQVETIIMNNNGDVVSQMRSAHRLILQPSFEGASL